MTLTDAKNIAAARSKNHKNCQAVIKSTATELHSGYYVETDNIAIPAEQIFTRFCKGVEIAA